MKTRVVPQEIVSQAFADAEAILSKTTEAKSFEEVKDIMSYAQVLGTRLLALVTFNAWNVHQLQGGESTLVEYMDECFNTVKFEVRELASDVADGKSRELKFKFDKASENGQS